MRVQSLGLSPGQSRVVVDVLVLLTWTFVVPPIAMLALLPWRQLLPTGRLLLLMGVGLVMAVLTVTAELWRRRGDRARRFADDLARPYVWQETRRQVKPDAFEGMISYEPMTDDQWRELERICRS